MSVQSYDVEVNGHHYRVHYEDDRPSKVLHFLGEASAIVWKAGQERKVGASVDKALNLASDKRKAEHPAQEKFADLIGLTIRQIDLQSLGDRHIFTIRGRFEDDEETVQTQDYRGDRLNVVLGDKGIIKEIIGRG